MSKKAMDHVDARALAEEALWRTEAEAEAGDEPVEVVVKQPPAHKDTKRWCKGKVGREHTLAIAMPANAWRTDCRWAAYMANGAPWFNCQHVELCTTCGKIVRRSNGWLKDSELKPQDCPDYRPHEAAHA